MSREKKDYVPISARLDAEAYEMLKKYCEDTGHTRTAAIERILKKAIKVYFEKPEEERRPY